MGDFNSDILFKGESKDQTHQGRRLLQVTNRYNLKNIIASPTCICESIETAIDLIFVSDLRKIATSGTFEPAISDHKLVYVVLDVRKNKTQPFIKVLRDFKNANVQSLKNSMEKVPWWVCNVLEDVNDSLYMFEELYKDVINEHIKLRTVKVRAKGLPWVTREHQKSYEQKVQSLDETAAK